MANGTAEKDAKRPPLSFDIPDDMQAALERLHGSDRAAPSWAYTCRRALEAGLKVLGFPIVADELNDPRR